MRIHNCREGKQRIHNKDVNTLSLKLSGIDFNSLSTIQNNTFEFGGIKFNGYKHILSYYYNHTTGECDIELVDDFPQVERHCECGCSCDVDCKCGGDV